MCFPVNFVKFLRTAFLQNTCSCFFISLIVGKKIDTYWIVYGLVTIDFLCFVAKMDQILT